MDKRLYRELYNLAAKTTKKREDAEDATQTAVLKLLTTPAETIEKPRNYARTAVFNHSLQLVRQRRIATRASQEEFDSLSSEDAHVDYYAREVLLQALSLLPKCRREVMAQLLAGKSLPEIPGKYYTNATHYKLALKELQEYFKLKERNAIKALDRIRRIAG